MKTNDEVCSRKVTAALKARLQQPSTSAQFLGSNHGTSTFG